MKRFPAMLNRIWVLTITTFEEDDLGEYTHDVIFTCAYGTRAKAYEAKEKARAMFPTHADIEYSIERVVFVQDELPSDEEDMAYDMMGKVAKEKFEKHEEEGK